MSKVSPVMVPWTLECPLAPYGSNVMNFDKTDQLRHRMQHAVPRPPAEGLAAETETIEFLGEG